MGWYYCFIAAIKKPWTVSSPCCMTLMKACAGLCARTCVVSLAKSWAQIPRHGNSGGPKIAKPLRRHRRRRGRLERPNRVQAPSDFAKLETSQSRTQVRVAGSLPCLVFGEPFGFPAAAKRAVKLDKREAFVELNLNEIVLGGEQLLLFLEDFEVTGATGHVTLGRDLDRLLVGFDRASLLNGRFGILLTGDQGVGNFLESVDDCGL